MGGGFQNKEKKMAGRPLPEELPESLLMGIEKVVLLGCVQDFLRLSQTCKSLRATGTKVATFTDDWPTIPYLMLPEKEDCQDREFYSIVHKGVTMSLPLPEATGKMCVEARFGWLLIHHHSGEARLLNPLKPRSEIILPNFLSLYRTNIFPTSIPFPYLRKAVLSTNPSSPSDDLVLAVLTSEQDLGFWKRGDRNWTYLRLPYYDRGKDLNYHGKDEKFYVVGSKGYVYSLDHVEPKVELVFDQQIFHPRFMTANWLSGCSDHYLVATSGAGQLLLIYRNGTAPIRVAKHEHVYGTTDFVVFRVDLRSNSYREINTLGGESIFIGHNAAFSVPASEGSEGIKPNAIYFSDDSTQAYLTAYHTCTRCGMNTRANATLCPNKIECAKELKRPYPELERPSGTFTVADGGGKNLGIYNLHDGRIERFTEDMQRLCSRCPSLWITLSSSFSASQ